MSSRSIAAVMSEAYRLAMGGALPPEKAVQFLRDPEAFCDVIRSSGALYDPTRRADLEKLLREEAPDGV